MSIRSKCMILFAALSLLLSMSIIQDTYAKYLTSATSMTDMTIARWRILVNNEDIRTNSTAQTLITPILQGNDNISSGVIAPTAEGYFDLLIDSSNVDVSFHYAINISVNADSVVQDLVVTGYEVNGGMLATVDDSQQITGAVNINDNPGTTSLRIYIKWDDSDTQTMTNQADTEATTIENGKASLDVSMSFIQTPTITS